MHRLLIQWLREGFAEWLSMQVVARLGGLAYPGARRRHADAISGTVTLSVATSGKV